ncbi:MAG: aquaporin family protein [Bauldia sp.]|nr:aquaporin family protein [Bauldia sp.]
MSGFDLPRRLAAEALGSCFLVATVVGSGIMATRLSDDVAVALLCNAIATGAMLAVLIAILAPFSGAHFNPAVTLVAAGRREAGPREAAFYIVAQVGGAVAGTVTAHFMFGLPPVAFSAIQRHGAGQWFAEGIATFGLVSVILLGRRSTRRALPWLVGLYIAAAYWFTASTSFANPAVTVARMLTDTFAGIRPVDVPAFVAAQLAGAACAAGLAAWLFRSPAIGRATPTGSRLAAQAEPVAPRVRLHGGSNRA